MAHRVSPPLQGHSRRRVLLTVGLGALSAGCGSVGFGVEAVGSPAADGRFASRLPKTPPGPVSVTGAQPLGLDNGRDGVLYIPPGLTGPAPLLLLLHGATGSAARITQRLNAFANADAFKMVILAPDSREGTWDVVRKGFGLDVAFVDRALAQTFERVALDPKRIAVGGFSDGASYALSLGLMNGDLFTHIAAFSPGFFVADAPVGKPLIYISHGQQDEILPIDNTSRRLRPRLERAGYDVRYREFPGPHTVPAPVLKEALEWIAGKP
jgi:phospholipase/carboxylesterase